MPFQKCLKTWQKHSKTDICPMEVAEGWGKAVFLSEDGVCSEHGGCWQGQRCLRCRIRPRGAHHVPITSCKSSPCHSSGTGRLSHQGEKSAFGLKTSPNGSVKQAPCSCLRAPDRDAAAGGAHRRTHRPPSGPGPAPASLLPPPQPQHRACSRYFPTASYKPAHGSLKQG